MSLLPMVKRNLKWIFQWEFAPVILLVLINLIIGGLISIDFGIGWDETLDIQYGIDALRSYESDEIDWNNYGKRKYYGPAYFMFQEWAAIRLNRLFPASSLVGLRHYVTFAVFQIAILAFYLLSRRLFSKPTAITITLLFAFQPL